MSPRRYKIEAQNVSWTALVNYISNNEGDPFIEEYVKPRKNFIHNRVTNQIVTEKAIDRLVMISIVARYLNELRAEWDAANGTRQSEGSEGMSDGNSSGNGTDGADLPRLFNRLSSWIRRTYARIKT